jgi:hypothetical protein
VSADPATLIPLARSKLGELYGLGRKLRKVELARLIAVTPDYLARVEKGQVDIGGPIRVCLGMLLAGHRSPWHEEALRSRYGRGGGAQVRSICE